MKQESDLTKGNLWKQIGLFSIPLILSNLFQVLFNMSDIAVVGRFAGSEALGAVGSTTILVSLFTGFLIGAGTGVNVLVAQALGKRNDRELNETVHTSVIVCLIIGLVIMAFTLLTTRWFLVLLHTKDELIDGAALYLHIYFLGMPALALYNYGNAVYSAAGNTKKPLMYLMSAGVLNVILNLYFVIILKMSVAGVALASIISQYLTALLVIFALVRSKENYGIRISDLRLNIDKTKKILALAIPSGFQYAIFQIANLFIQSSVNSFPTIIVEGNSAAANADNLVYDVMAAFYTACSSFVGQNYGAGNKKRIRHSYYISLFYSFAIAAIMSAFLVIFSKEFLSLFTTDPAVIEAGKMRLTVMGCSYAFSAFMDDTLAASRGLGKSVVPSFIVIMGSCVFRIIWIYTIFAYFRTIFSIYILYIFSWTITATCEIIYFIHIYKKQVAVLPEK